MRFISAATALLLATSSATSSKSPSIEAQIVGRERQSWAAWQNKDVAFWKRHLSGDHVEIDSPAGPQDRNYVINGVAGRTCAVTTYNLDNFSFRQLGPNAAMVVYRATQEFACGDKRIPNTGWVTSIYRRGHGDWENVLFEHMAVPPPKPPQQPKN